MTFRVLSRDGRQLMQTHDVHCIDPAHIKSQKEAGCRFRVEDADPAELDRLEKLGVKVVRK